MISELGRFWQTVSGPIALVLTALSVGLAWYSIDLQRRLRMLSVQHIKHSARKLSKKVLGSGFSPDILIVPDPKNAIIAHFMKDSFSNSPTIFVGFQVYIVDVDEPPDRKGFETISTARSYIMLPSSISQYSDQKALIVDSIQKSGSTFMSIKEKLEQLGFGKDNVKSSCIVRSINFSRTPKPDFHHRELDGKIIFPWGEVDV